MPAVKIRSCKLSFGVVARIDQYCLIVVDICENRLAEERTKNQDFEAERKRLAAELAQARSSQPDSIKQMESSI